MLKYMINFKRTFSGFTLVEILIVLFLVGLLALPFTNMFIFGVQGSHDNSEHVLAYNLAREKIEELRGLPPELIKSDYANFQEVFQDRPDFEEACYNEDAFVKYFSDVFTDKAMTDDKIKMTYSRLRQIYPKVYLKNLKTYPEDYRFFRRVVKVDEILQLGKPGNLKKITVMVFEKDGKRIAQLVTLVGQQK